MKILLLGLLVLVSFSFSACSAKKGMSEAEYNRANSSSAESLRGLDRDAK